MECHQYQSTMLMTIMNFVIVFYSYFTQIQPIPTIFQMIEWIKLKIFHYEMFAFIRFDRFDESNQIEMGFNFQLTDRIVFFFLLLFNILNGFHFASLSSYLNIFPFKLDLNLCEEFPTQKIFSNNCSGFSFQHFFLFDSFNKFN